MIQIQGSDDTIIRPLLLDDAQALNEIAAHPRVARTLLQLPSKEIAQTESRLLERTPGLHRLIAEKNGTAVGAAILSQPQNPRRVHNGSLGLMIHPDFWGQGIGAKLMTAIVDLADNWINIKRLELGVLTDNSVAIHLYRKFGFKPEGTRKSAVFSGGRIQDQLIMARLDKNAPEVKLVSPPEFAPPVNVTSIHVRPTKASDAVNLHEIFTHPAVGYGTNQIPSQELSATREWLKQQNPGVYRYSAVAQHETGSSKVVGNLTMHQPQNPRLVHSAWFGMSIHPQYWGQGIGTQLVAAAIDLADNWLGLKRIELEVHTDNPAAIHLYEKFGFVLEGTKHLYSFGAGRWADVHFMARLFEAS